MSAVRDALQAFSEKKFSMDQVMRALVEHDDWYVPVHALEGNVAGATVIYSQEFSMPKSPLLLFTDRAAADEGVAKIGHQAMGVYCGGVAGTDIFSRLEAFAEAQAVQINCGSPTSQQWFVARGGFSLCALWAGVPPFEKLVSTMGEGVVDKLRAYTGWLVLIAKSDKTFVRFPVGGAEHALAFTAPDLADAMTRNLQADQQAQVTTAVLTGAPLFKLLSNAKYGLVINPNSHKQTVLPPKGVAALAED